MKKVLCYLMILTTIILSLCSCGKKEEVNNNMQNDTSSITEEISSLESETTAPTSSETESETTENNEFEDVEITLENYENYFEIKKLFQAFKDDFGDYTGNMTYDIYLCLKDEYEADTRTFGKSTVKVKFDVSYVWRGFDFNEETGEGTFLDVIEAYNNVYTKTETLRNISYDEGWENYNYGARINSADVDTWPHEEGGFAGKYKYSIEDIGSLNITGITGNLRVRKKAN